MEVPKILLIETVSKHPTLSSWATNEHFIELLAQSLRTDISGVESVDEEAPEIPMFVHEIAFHMSEKASPELRKFIDNNMDVAARAIVLGQHIKRVNGRSADIINLVDVYVAERLNKRNLLFLTATLYTATIHGGFDEILICEHYRGMIDATEFAYNNLKLPADLSEPTEDSNRELHRVLAAFMLKLHREQHPDEEFLRKEGTYLMLSFATGSRLRKEHVQIEHITDSEDLEGVYRPKPSLTYRKDCLDIILRIEGWREYCDQVSQRSHRS